MQTSSATTEVPSSGFSLGKVDLRNAGLVLASSSSCQLFASLVPLDISLTESLDRCGW